MMPPLRLSLLGAWGAALLMLARRGGMRPVLSALLLGAAPMLAVVTAFADVLAPVTGLFSQKALDEAKREAAAPELARLESLAQEEGESLEWMNFLVKQMWPGITEYAENMIRSYEPMIKASLPIPGANIRFKTCSIGKQPIRCGSGRGSVSVRAVL